MSVQMLLIINNVAWAIGATILAIAVINVVSGQGKD